MRAHRMLGLSLILLIASVGVAQDSAPPQLHAVAQTLQTRITSVTLYRGRASVTRTASIDLEPGLYDLKIENLPEAIQPESIQARAEGNVRVLNVEYAQEQVTTPPGHVAELDTNIEELQRSIEAVAQELEVIKAQEQFIDALSARAAEQAKDASGTEQLNLDSMRQHIAFIGEERSKLMAARRDLDLNRRELEKQLQAAQANRNAIAGTATVSRVATLTVTALESATATLHLSYIVANATWEPAYNVRAMLDGSSAQIEYEAMLMQRTGEDWNDVQLTLSTAQPTLAANPPTLAPWFVDIWRPMPADAAPPRARMQAPASKAADPSLKGSPDLEELRSLSSDASVAGEGPSVTFELPRRVTVQTNVQKQQRTRIATINTRPKFVHVAVPALTEAVYVRGDLINASPYQLLPGRASIFVGQDFVGPTTIGSVAPNGEFQLHFGIDASVKATRQLVSKKTETTGLLSGGRRTSYDYRLTIDNGSGKTLNLELWDRYPISRTSEIQIETVDMSHALANDPEYVNEQLPQGLLKWMMTVPPAARDQAAEVVTYGVRIHRAKDVEMTGLPE